MLSKHTKYGIKIAIFCALRVYSRQLNQHLDVHVSISHLWRSEY